MVQQLLQYLLLQQQLVVSWCVSRKYFYDLNNALLTIVAVPAAVTGFQILA